MNLKLSLYTSTILVLILLLSGCVGGSKLSSQKVIQEGENTLSRISDMPFPEGSKLSLKNSLLLGEGKAWSGQLLISVPDPKVSVFNFYVRNLDNFGWKEQTTIRGETSILTFVGENNRVAIININEGKFNTSEVLISVSPYAEAFEEKLGDFINEQYLEIAD